MSNAMVMTEYGPASVLRWTDVEPPQPAEDEIRIRVRAAGVGPTDLAIRSGHLSHVFPYGPGAVLGFEAAGTVDAIGAAVSGVAVGDPVVAVLQAHLGGYGELAVTPVWSRKPDAISWEAAATIPASAEVAIRVLDDLQVAAGQTVLVLGAAGAAGTLVTQLALARGAKVVGVASPRDLDALSALGATAIAYGGDLLADVRAATDTVDAVVDAAGHGGLPAAVELAGGPERVLTLSDPSGPSIGVAISEPRATLDRGVLDDVLPLIASGQITLKPHRTLPIEQAAEAHELLESGATHDKLVLTFAER
jgi:NADPH:quinone reductase-like Zn-dependent oxidoreductase